MRPSHQIDHWSLSCVNLRVDFERTFQAIESMRMSIVFSCCWYSHNYSHSLRMPWTHILLISPFPWVQTLNQRSGGQKYTSVFESSFFYQYHARKCCVTWLTSNEWTENERRHQQGSSLSHMSGPASSIWRYQMELDAIASQELKDHVSQRFLLCHLWSISSHELIIPK